MNSVYIICGVIVFIAGMFLGLGTELMVNSRTLYRLEKENKHLRAELAEKQRLSEMEVIEIVDHREAQFDKSDR